MNFPMTWARRKILLYKGRWQRCLKNIHSYWMRMKNN
nr:MAG TPA: hypothetical protein [Bacteriophage sp.]